jgi:LmeA-like phospholipid-binding
VTIDFGSEDGQQAAANADGLGEEELSLNSPKTSSHSLISKVLTPAVKLWLRSQLDQVEALELDVEAGDRQLLSGSIGRVAIGAEKAIYKGLHLTQVQVVGENIRVNLNQMLRGKPFRLLTEFPVTGQVCLSAADLNASLQSPLLGDAVIDFLLMLLKSDGDSDLETETDLQLQDPQATLSAGQITLNATLVSASGKAIPVIVRTGLAVENGSTLKLDRPQWLPHANAQRGLPLKELHGFAFDLGSHVTLEALAIAPEQITCRGRIIVMPEIAS